MEVGYLYKMITGLERDSAHWLGYRFDAETGFHPERADFWIGSMHGTEMRTSLRHGLWVTGLYQTDSVVWACESAGHVFKNPTLGLSSDWEFITLRGVLRGIWGLNDDCVFTWGMADSRPIAFHWDGREWREVSSPGYIVRVHGSAPDFIYAVGQRGLIARWNGVNGFEQLPSPAKKTLSDVHVVSPDEIWACGHGGELLSGTEHGWETLLTHADELNCCAKWQDRVWVGGMDGLHRLDGETLENIKPNLQPHRLDGRGELLITQPTMMIRTTDGAKFNAIFLDGFETLASRKSIEWM